MIAARVQATASREPFADDSAGLDYFATDFHYEHVVARLCGHLTATRGFVLISGTPAPDGELVERAINARKEGPHRATLVRCRPGMALDAVTRAYGRQLGLKEDIDGTGTGQWALLSRLMEDSRKGVLRVLVLENADALDDRSFDELHRFTTLDDPHFLPVVLLTSRRFTARLDAPTLQFLQPAIVAHLALEHLESEEVAAFIRYQLNATDGRLEATFTRGIIAAIADAAKGDPAAVNRLARQTAGIVAPRPVPPAPPVTQAAPATPVTQATPPAPSLAPPSRPEATPQQIAQALSPPAAKPSKSEPRLTKTPVLPRAPKILLPLAPKSQLPAAAKSSLPAVRKKAEPPAAPSAAAPPVAVPPPPGAPLVAAATRESIMARLSVSPAQRRAVTLGVTIAGYVLLAAGSAAGLFYWLGPERTVTTVAADAPQIQTVIAGDIPALEPRPAPPAALEPPPAVPPAPTPIAIAAPPPVAPAPEMSASTAPSVAAEKTAVAVEPPPPVAAAAHRSGAAHRSAAARRRRRSPSPRRSLPFRRRPPLLPPPCRRSPRRASARRASWRRSSRRRAPSPPASPLPRSRPTRRRCRHARPTSRRVRRRRRWCAAASSCWRPATSSRPVISSSAPPRAAMPPRLVGWARATTRCSCGVSAPAASPATRQKPPTGIAVRRAPAATRPRRVWRSSW